MARLSYTYTGNFVDERGDVIVCLALSVGGGPNTFLSVRVPARSLDTQEVHDAMARAALALVEHHDWREEFALD